VNRKTPNQPLLQESRSATSITATVLYALMGVVAGDHVNAQPPQPSDSVLSADRTKESNVKGAYLYNFARYVTWPENSQLLSSMNFI
jgi:hypothetical protein